MKHTNILKLIKYIKINKDKTNKDFHNLQYILMINNKPLILLNLLPNLSMVKTSF